MKAQELRTKSVEELNAELVNLLGEQFKLRMQAAHRSASTNPSVKTSAS